MTPLQRETLARVRGHLNGYAEVLRFDFELPREAFISTLREDALALQELLEELGGVEERETDLCNQHRLAVRGVAGNGAKQ